MKKAFLLAFGLLCGLFLLTGYSQAATYNWTKVNQSGFGVADNNYMADMTVFDGKMYASAINIYSDPSGASGHAAGGVWKTSNGTSWSLSNTVGFGDSNNGATYNLITFNNYLYAAVQNYETGVEIWRTSNGSTWSQVNTDGFGDKHIYGVNAAVVFNNKLHYLIESGGIGGEHLELWSSSNGTTWAKVGSNDFGGYTDAACSNLVEYDGYIYAGIDQQYGTLAKVIKSKDGVTWQQVNKDGFGDSKNTGISNMITYSNKLYVATEKWDGSSYGTGTEIWRTSDGTNWSQVGGDGLGVYDIAINYHMTEFNGFLILSGLHETGVNSTEARILSSKDGKNWEEIGDSRFFNAEKSVAFNNKFYTSAGSNKKINEVEVWRLDSALKSEYSEVVEKEKSAQTTIDTELAERLSGRILIQTEEKGEAWYVSPSDNKKYYLGRPHNAFDIMRDTGLGITDANLNRIPVYGTSWGIDGSLAPYVTGRIVIQTEQNGEAWYVSPINLKRYSMGRPAEAFELMRNLGLGASNDDIRKIEVGE